MSKLLGVRATVSFDGFRAGKAYEVDLEDQRMLSLLGVGYLEAVTEEVIEDDVDRPGDSDLRDVRVLGSSEAAAEVSEGVENVEDRAESGGDAGKRPGQSVRGRSTSDGKGASGGTDSRAKGVA